MLEPHQNIENLIEDCTKDVFTIFEVPTITTDKKKLLDSIFHIIYLKGKSDGIEQCERIYKSKKQ